MGARRSSLVAYGIWSLGITDKAVGAHCAVVDEDEAEARFLPLRTTKIESWTIWISPSNHITPPPRNARRLRGTALAPRGCASPKRALAGPGGGGTGPVLQTAKPITAARPRPC